MKKSSIFSKVIIFSIIAVSGLAGYFFTVNSDSYDAGILYWYSANSPEAYRGSILWLSDNNANDLLKKHNWGVFTYTTIQIAGERYWTAAIYVHRFISLFLIALLTIFIIVRKKLIRHTAAIAPASQRLTSQQLK